MAQHEILNETTSLAEVKSLFAQPPGPWPAGWEGMPNVCQAFREMFDAASRSLPAPPRWESERGIVICAGGWRFFASLYVTVRMIRHVGCNLPVQVWYLGDRGEFDPRMQAALADFDVGWVNGNAFARDHGLHRRILGGWELKPFAAAYCPFREVISLDADCYPAYNPEEFMATGEFQRVGAAFWPDQGKLEPGQWERFGIPYHDEPAWETGQFIVDKARHWNPLALTIWLNDHSDYVYHHVYGDKDTFHLAWRKVGHEVCVPTAWPAWHVVAFLQMDFGGRPLFIHRCRDKFRWNGQIDGSDVPGWFMTSQWHPETQFVEGLPHEQLAHDFCRESSELVRPLVHYKFLAPSDVDAAAIEDRAAAVVMLADAKQVRRALAEGIFIRSKKPDIQIRSTDGNAVISVSDLTASAGGGGIQLSAEKTWTFEGTVAVVENADAFWRYELVLPEIDLAVLSGGNMSARLVNWLASADMEDCRILHWGDYDPVGVWQYRRLFNACIGRVDAYAPSAVDELLPKYGKRRLVTRQSSYLDRLRKYETDPYVHRMITLFDQHRRGLEQEILLRQTAVRTR